MGPRLPRLHAGDAPALSGHPVEGAGVNRDPEGLQVEEELRLVLLEMDHAEVQLHPEGRGPRIPRRRHLTRREVALPRLGIHGRKEGKWVCLDYAEIVVHIFERDARRFYDLENLWVGAPKVAVEFGPQEAAPDPDAPFDADEFSENAPGA